MNLNDQEPHVLTHVPKVRHTYYVCASVKAREDWNTKEVNVTGQFGIAPDGNTIIEYPVHVWMGGYWNKGNTKKVISIVKKRLLEEMAKIGYGKKDLTEPFEISPLR